MGTRSLRTNDDMQLNEITCYKDNIPKKQCGRWLWRCVWVVSIRTLFLLYATSFCWGVWGHVVIGLTLYFLNYNNVVGIVFEVIFLLIEDFMGCQLL